MKDSFSPIDPLLLPRIAQLLLSEREGLYIGRKQSRPQSRSIRVVGGCQEWGCGLFVICGN